MTTRTKNDQVKMCAFMLIWKSDIWHEINKGFLELIIKRSFVTNSK